MRKRFLKFVAVIATISILHMPTADAWFWGRPSPAGCEVSPNDAHPSEYYHGAIGYSATTECDAMVASMTLEMWGDRSSWSGWRQHTPRHAQKTYANSREIKVSQHPYGLEGTYNYRTRARGWSHETSGTYYESSTGVSRRITCELDPGSVILQTCH